MPDSTPFRPRKPFVLGSFLLVALVAVGLFVPTFAGHTAVMNKVSIDATTTDYHVADDGETLVVQVRVRNPTGSAFTARYASLYGNVDGKQLTSLGVEIRETTVPAGETKTVTAHVGIKDGYSEEVADAVESGTLRVTGQLRGSIQDAEVQIDVTEGDDG
jgi:hypothetical protein